MHNDIVLREKFGLAPAQAKFVVDFVEGRGRNFHHERTPNMLAAIGWETRRRMALSAPMAFGVIESIAFNEKIAPKIRLDAAKDILNRVGIIPPRAAPDKNSTDLPLNELTVPDLRALASKLEAEIATRGDKAKAISAPQAPVLDTQLSDLLG